MLSNTNSGDNRKVSSSAKLTAKCKMVIKLSYINCEKKANHKALFVVSTTTQAEMFKQITEELQYWDNVFINIDKWYRKDEVDRVLTHLNVSHRSVEKVNTSEIRNIIMKEDPDIIIFGNDNTLIDRLFIKCANSMGIPTLLVQDGFLDLDEIKKTVDFKDKLRYLINIPRRTIQLFKKKDRSLYQKTEIMLSEFFFGKKGGAVIYGHGECTKMAVFGNAIKDLFVSDGISPDRIVVTGNPKFDKLFRIKNKNSKKNVCEKWNIPYDAEIILLLTSYFVEAKMWSVEQREDFVLAIANAAAKLGNSHLIIKIHPPNERENDYQQIVRGLKNVPLICKYESLPELLDACSLAIIAFSSTTALEAMALQKPVIIVNLFNNVGPSIFEMSGSIFVTREKDIFPAIEKALYNPTIRNEMFARMRDFVYDQANLQDGQAAKRIAELIITMVA